jgi:Flp pilus assembly pilin Flp
VGFVILAGIHFYPAVGGIMPHTQKGQGLTEYALVLMLIALVVVAILSVTADDIVTMYEYIIAQLPF